VKVNRQAWLDLVLAVEGGYVNDPHDPGRATNRGITKATLAAHRRCEVTDEDVKNLTVEECSAILSGRYWNLVQGDKLPPGLDVLVADMAVHSGTQRAAKTLQRVVGAKVDGHVGPKTLEAARAARFPEVLHRFADVRLDFLKALPGWGRFGKGWDARVRRVHAAAVQLAKEQMAERPEPIPVAKRKVTTEAVVAAAGAVVAAIPAARDAYQQAATATASLGELAVWLPAAIGLLVALGTLALLARRGLKLADQQ
jgi:lysozyme family protein